MRSEADACWGGRNWTFQSDAQRQWLERMAERGWTVPDWPKDYGGGGLSPAEAKVLKEEMARIGARHAADQLRHLDARPGAAQVRHRGAEEALSCPRSRAARSAGARAIPSRAPAPTSPGCRPRRRTRATTGWSTARRSGPATPTRPTGSSAWSAPRPSPSRAGSASCCSTWRRPGVSTRPILLISGNSPFCETFFDDVKVPEGPGRRRGEQGLGRRQISARPRARDDQRAWGSAALAGRSARR